MAYDRTKLLHIGGVSPLPQVWQYFSSDSVTAKGYIPKEEGVRAGDQVEVVNITYSSGLITAYSATKYYAVADANGDLTLTAYSEGSEVALATRVTAIEAVIPTGATSSNKLVDSNTVSAIQDVIPEGASAESKLALASSVTAIQAVIPAEASADNQLADKAYVATNYEPKAQ